MGSLPEIVEDIQGLLQVFSDGSIFRQPNINLNIPIHHDNSVIWKDFIFDTKNNLRLRVYKPVHVSPPKQKSLPVFYFFHGGGFCFGSCTWANNHNTCQRLSSGLQAIIVAPDYRLAPEHRLPAAMDDALTSLEWLEKKKFLLECKWLNEEEVDFDRVYIIGDSSGGNMAHHLAVQLGPGSPALAPVRVRGYILMAPFFGGTERTMSEEGEPEPLLTLDLLDRFWRLALPTGKNADHPLANPFGEYSRGLETVMVDPILVIAGSKELLKDRVKNYANKLQEEQGKKVEYVEFEGKHHGFFLNEPYSEIGNKVLQHIQHFTSKFT